jgi:hypothetical protein
MPLPIRPQVSFNGPCYLIYADQSRFSSASLKLYNEGVISTVTLNPHTFTRVEGTCFNVTITPEAGSAEDFPAESMLSVGPNAWGILQPIDGGVIGYGLAMIDNGQDVNVMFKNPQPLPPGVVGSTPPAATTFSIFIRDGSVNNGLSDESLLSVTYQLIGGPTHTTPPVPTGKETGDLLSAELLSFQLRSIASPVSWYPTENVEMQQGMSLVVFGDYSAPSLAIMVEVGPVKIVKLALHTVPGS